jgi:hypothetical protein
MEIGMIVEITKEPWNQFSGEMVIVTKIDADGKGFDFVIPERRGHSPMKFAIASYGIFNLEKLGIKI